MHVVRARARERARERERERARETEREGEREGDLAILCHRYRYAAKDGDSDPENDLYHHVFFSLLYQ